MSLLDLVAPPQPPTRQGRRVSSSGVLDERVKAKLKAETEQAVKERLAEQKRQYYRENKDKWRDTYAKNRKAKLAASRGPKS